MRNNVTVTITESGLTHEQAALYFAQVNAALSNRGMVVALFRYEPSEDDPGLWTATATGYLTDRFIDS